MATPDPNRGEPGDVEAIMRSYSDCLATSHAPKLFIKGKPGPILGRSALEF